MNSKNNQNKKNNVDEVFDTKTEIASEENVVQEDSNETDPKELLNNIQKNSKPPIVNKNEYCSFIFLKLLECRQFILYVGFRILNIIASFTILSR